MKRFSEDSLLQWFHNSRRKPLVMRGARQVGKSTLVRNFAANNNLVLNEINLERHMELTRIFETMNMAVIKKELDALVRRNILEPSSLLFLDEIQAVPAAIQALRYFYEDFPDLPVIAAGSLLEFALSRANFSMPVGRINYFYLGPMSFDEYLYNKDQYLYSCLSQFDFSEEMPETTHISLIENLKEFLYIGGMPEAIGTYLENGNFQDVFDIQNSIIETYQDDFNKYASGSKLVRLHHLFAMVPSLIGKKVKYSTISREEKSRELKDALSLLTRAGIVIPVFHSGCNGLPLNAEINRSVYKLLFLDVGLVNRICGLDWSSLSVKDTDSLVNSGPLAEQFIGQHLLYSNGFKEKPGICYWLREKKLGNAEVDYVVSRRDQIIPIEVKAGKSGSLKSLMQFCLSKNTNIAVRFDANRASTGLITHHLRQKNRTEEVRFKLISLPLYSVGQIKRLFDLIPL